MAITQKCQYALRAIYELSLRSREGTCKIGAIAEAQGIPARFLENILSSLKSAGFVESARGKDGGYYLAKPPSEITVGEVIRFIQGPLGPVECTTRTDEDCELYDDCVFRPMWDRARKALEEVYDGTTFRDLTEQTANPSVSPQSACRCRKK